MVTLINMLSKIKNGQNIYLDSVIHKDSKLCREFLDVLIEEGFICGYRRSGGLLEIRLKYYKFHPVIQKIDLISKPSHKVYFSFYNLLRIKRFNFKIYFFFTNFGILTQEECLRRRIGGELLCIIE